MMKLSQSPFFHNMPDLQSDLHVAPSAMVVCLFVGRRIVLVSFERCEGLTEMLDFAVLKVQILKAMRGTRSQIQISRALGYKHNQVYRWESNRTKITWRDFVRFTKICEAPLAEALEKLLLFTGTPYRYDKLILQLAGNTNRAALASQLGCSAYMLSRWMNRRTEPSLENILKMIQVCSNALFETLDVVVGCDLIPLIKEESRLRRLERQLYFENPAAAAVVRCLELEEYSRQHVHEEGYVAKKLGISLADEKFLIHKLKECGAIVSIKSKLSVKNRNLNTRRNFFESMTHHKYWLQFQTDAIESGQQREQLSKNCGTLHLLFTANEKTYDKFRTLYQQFYGEAVAILNHKDNQQDEDRVIALNIAFADLFQLSLVKKRLLKVHR